MHQTNKKNVSLENGLRPYRVNQIHLPFRPLVFGNRMSFRMRKPGVSFIYISREKLLFDTSDTELGALD